MMLVSSPYANHYRHACGGLRQHHQTQWSWLTCVCVCMCACVRTCVVVSIVIEVLVHLFPLPQPYACLTALNLCMNRIGDAGIATLSSFVRNHTSLSALDLSYNEVGDAGAIALAAVLPQSTVRILFLGNSKLSDAGTAALAACLSDAPLHTLDLSGPDDGVGGLITDAGAQALATALQAPKLALTRLSLQRQRIGETGALALAHSFKNCPSLTQIDLYGQTPSPISATIDDALSALIKQRQTRGKSTNSISGSGCSVPSTLDSEARAVDLAALAADRIGLDEDQFGDVGALDLIAQVRANTPHLTQIKLWDHRLTDASCFPLAQALKTATMLSVLDLGGNAISDAGAIALVCYLCCSCILVASPPNQPFAHINHTCLLLNLLEASHMFLDLFFHKVATLVVCVCVCVCVMCVLEYLPFVPNPLKTYLSDGKQADALMINQSLTDLRLSNNNITSVGSAALATALQVSAFAFCSRVVW
jgi:Ran GTPase-activating protein (RanGAP) involved in mRNA processing and transport